MKARRIIGGTIALLGLTAAVSIQDRSSYEILIRSVGALMFAAGAYIAKAFDFQDNTADKP